MVRRAVIAIAIRVVIVGIIAAGLERTKLFGENFFAPLEQLSYDSSPKTYVLIDGTENDHHIASTRHCIRRSCPRQNGRGESQAHR